MSVNNQQTMQLCKRVILLNRLFVTNPFLLKMTSDVWSYHLAFPFYLSTQPPIQLPSQSHNQPPSQSPTSQPSAHTASQSVYWEESFCSGGHSLEMMDEFLVISFDPLWLTSRLPCLPLPLCLSVCLYASLSASIPPSFSIPPSVLPSAPVSLYRCMA